MDRLTARNPYHLRSSTKKEVQQEREDGAHDEAGDERKVERQVLPLDVNVAGQPAEPWQLRQQEHRGADRRDDDPHHHEQTSHVVHEPSMRRAQGDVQSRGNA